MKNGRAAGTDDVPAEALKVGIGTSTEALYRLFETTWEEEEIPRDWKEGILIQPPKKGALMVRSSYRGITLLSTPDKVLNKILLDRIKAAVDNQLRDQQERFRKDRSCTDQISTLRIIVEQSLESLYINICACEKAIAFHVSSCYGLDSEDHHRGNKEWNSVDPPVTAGGLRLR